MLEIIKKYYDRWLSNKEVIDVRCLKRRQIDVTHVYYDCPCGSEEHFAARFFIAGTNNLSNILTCFETLKQWVIVTDVANIIKTEEENYLRLLNNAEKVVKKVLKKRPANEDTVRFLKETHGIPEDISRDLML